MNEQETVEEFEKKVMSACPQLKTFKISSEGGANLEGVLKSKFSVQINKQKYDVYPQFESMVSEPKVSPEVMQLVDQAFEGRSIPISRRVVLGHYVASVLNQSKGKTLTKDQLKQVFQNAIREFAKDSSEKIYKNPSE